VRTPAACRAARPITYLPWDEFSITYRYGSFTFRPMSDKKEPRGAHE